MGRKILLLIPNFGYGGAQKVFNDHSLLLSEFNDVVEVVFNLENKLSYPSGNKVISLEVPAGRNVIDKAFRFLQRIYRFRKVLRLEKPDLIISHLEGADYVNILAGGRTRKLLVVHGSKAHDQNIGSWLGGLRKKVLIPHFYKRADKIVTVSEGIREELISSFRLPPHKIITIYNFFDLEEIQRRSKEDLPEEVQSLLKGDILITSGRLVNQKNHLALLHILKKINRDNSLSLKLVIIGDGNLFENLKEACDILSLKFCVYGNNTNTCKEVDVIFMGYHPNPLAFYQYAKIFVFPSAWEGFPMALGEAMCSGVPVVSADCPTGPLELIEPNWSVKKEIVEYPYWNENGVLLPIPDINDAKSLHLWSITIAKLLVRERAKGAHTINAQKRMKQLDRSAIKEEWLSLVNDLMRLM
jgi:glycosyltransferase involved in cell wall biosynthesis